MEEAAHLSIIESKEFYTLRGVKFLDGKYGAIDISKTLEECVHARAPWKDYEQNDWRPGSGPLITVALMALFDNKGVKGVQELRELFSEDFGKNLIMTSTRISYYPERQTVSVIHNFSTPEQSSGEFSLSNGYINKGLCDVTMCDVSEAFLGNPAANKVAEVYEWATGKKVYFYRAKQMLRRSEKRTLAIGCNNIYPDLNVLTLYNCSVCKVRGMRTTNFSTEQPKPSPYFSKCKP